jgi:hypothetical protein
MSPLLELMSRSPREWTTLLPALSLALFFTPLIGGCSTLQQMFPTVGMSSATVEPPPPAEAVMPQLQMLAELAVDAPEAHRSALFREIRDQYALFPTTANKFRLALALATPTHAEHDLSQGADMLDELLGEATLLPAERLLAQATRGTARALLAERDTRRAASLAEREAAVAAVALGEATQRRRNETLGAENRRLEQALAEAEQKLEALMSIERTIRERE